MGEEEPAPLPFPAGEEPAMAAGECIPALAIISAMARFAEPRAGEAPKPIFANMAFAFMLDRRPELARAGAGAGIYAPAPAAEAGR